jgi:hypothetical protein
MDSDWYAARILEHGKEVGLRLSIAGMKPFAEHTERDFRPSIISNLACRADLISPVALI